MSRSTVVSLSIVFTLLTVPLAAESPEEIRARAEALLSDQVQRALQGSVESVAGVEQALELYRSIGDGQGEALALLVRGLTALAAEDERRAAADFEASSARFASSGDLFAASMVLVIQGMSDRMLGHSERALAHFNSAIEQLHQLTLAGRPASLEGFLAMGRLFGAPTGQLEGAGPMLALITPMLASVMEGAARGERVFVLLDLGRIEEAEQELEQAQAKSELLGGLFVTSLDGAWGELRRQQWRLEEAKAHLEKSLENAGMFSLFSFAKDHRMQIAALRRLAEIDALAGHFGPALSWNDRALALATEDGDSARHASVLESRATLYLDQNLFDQAEQTLVEALGRARASGNSLRLATIQSDRGQLAYQRGAYGDAARFLEEAVAIFGQRGQVLLEAASSAALVEVYFMLASEASARSMLERGQAAAVESEWMPAQALLSLLAEIQSGQPGGLDAGQLRARLSELLQRIPGQDPWRDQLHRALTAPSAAPPQNGATERRAQPVELTLVSEFHLGHAALESGKIDLARSHWSNALGEARKLENADLTALLSAALATLDYREGRHAQALTTLRQAIAVMERGAQELRHTDLLSSYLGSGRHVFYDAIIQMLIEQGQVSEAFSYAERARARAFLQQLGNRRITATGGGDLGLTEHASALRQAIARWERELPSAAGAERLHLERDIGHAKADLEGLMTRIKVTSPEYAALVTIEPLDLAAVQQSLAPAESLVSYFISGTRAHVWVANRTSLEHVALDLGTAGIEDVLCFSAALGRDAGSATRGAEVISGCPDDLERATRLYRRLFSPLKTKLGSTRVVLVPHGVLHYLPFATLRDPDTGRYLLEDYTLSYLPSASALPFLRAKETSFEGRALVLGAPAATDPRLPLLPGAAAEARQVAEIWGTRPWLDGEATESKLHGLGGKIDLVHLAAHGLYNANSSSFTRIALAPDEAQDGNLEVHELLSGVDLSGVNLVMLSACETALGKRSAGDEVASLARAILYSGSPAVVSTLWKIDDLAAAELTVSFYRLLRAGQPASEALRQAQLALLADERFRAPYFWGAFTLTGEMAPPPPEPEAAVLPAPRAARGPAARRALLVGIGEYPAGSGWRRIASEQDVVLMRTTLESRGFSPSAIRELLNRDATRAGIVSAVEQALIEPSRPGDLALLFVASHGRLLPDDEPGDELDGYDEALVPYDAPVDEAPGALGEGIERYLRDDALGELLERLRRRLGPTGQVVVLLDACHSGTGARGEDMISGLVDGVRGMKIHEEGLAPLIVLSASRSGERALEVKRHDLERVGSLTWAISRELAQDPPPLTYRELAERARAALRGKVSNVLQAEGVLDSPLFLEAPMTWQLPYFTVIPIAGKDRWVRLRPGLLAGLTVGSELEIHPAGASGPAVGDPLTGARISEASPYEAIAELASPVAYDELVTARAFLVRDTATDLAPRLALNRYLRRLDLYDARLHTELEVVPVDFLDCPDPTTGTRQSCRVVAHPREQVRTLGEEIELPLDSLFELRITGSDDAAFISVLDLMSDGDIAVIWPPPGARERASAKPRPRTLNEVFQVTKPLGVDVLLLIASAEPIDFSPLRLPRLSGLSRGERERLGPLAPLLDEAFLQRGKAPDLTAVALSTSRQAIRIVEAPQRP